MPNTRMTGTPWENSSATASRGPAGQVIERAGDPAAHRPGRIFDHRAHPAPDPVLRDLGSLRQPGRVIAVAQGDQLAVGQEHLNLERGFKARRLTVGPSFRSVARPATSYPSA